MGTPQLTGSIELSTPIMINNKEIKKLTYDFNALDGEAYARADAYAANFATSRAVKSSFQEFNYSFQLYLGYELIIAVNKDIDIEDLKRIKGLDIPKISRLGRDFLLLSAAESVKKTSADVIETTQESTKSISED